MKTIRLALSLSLLLIFSYESSHAQPFIKEVNYFKTLDSIKPPPVHPILFIGSSSFTNWKDVQEYFPDRVILNRAFGGSSLPHLVLYAEDIIFRYQPKQIIIYCGENDLTAGSHITGDSVFQHFADLYQVIRKRLPRVPIAYVSMKPSASRLKYYKAMNEGNRLISEFISKQRRIQFINVYPHMLDANGYPIADIFLSDSLHMNKKGYKIWQPIIAPYLKK